MEMSLSFRSLARSRNPVGLGQPMWTGPAAGRPSPVWLFKLPVGYPSYLDNQQVSLKSRVRLC